MDFKVKIYLTIVTIFAILLGIFLYNNHFIEISLIDFIFFSAVLFLTNNMSVFFNHNELITNMVLPIELPIIVLYGPFWSAFILIMGTYNIKKRNNKGFVWYKFLYNKSMLFITGGLAALIYKYIGSTFNFTNKLLPIFITFISYIFFNMILMYILMYLLKKQSITSYFKNISITSLFSYFLGLLIYYSYINLGKFSVILIVIFIYLSTDFYYTKLKEFKTKKELTKAKEELKYSKLKNNFFRNLSHELKTPLNLIFSSLQMLELYNKEADKSQKYINITKQNSYRLLRLINNLLDLSKIEDNSFNLNLQNIDIIELLKNIKDSIKPHIKNEDKKIIFKTDIETKTIACDPYKLERAILNLISNAIKFTDVGDIITINLAEHENYLHISISDTGIGIKKNKQDIIFEEFGQVDKSLSRNHEGTGLGLPIVKSIVELHDGSISLESKYQEGSKFTIKLPDKKIEEEEVQNNYKNNEFDMIKLELSDIT